MTAMRSMACDKLGFADTKNTEWWADAGLATTRAHGDRAWQASSRGNDGHVGRGRTYREFSWIITERESQRRRCRGGAPKSRGRKSRVSIIRPKRALIRRGRKVEVRLFGEWLSKEKRVAEEAEEDGSSSSSWVLPRGTGPAAASILIGWVLTCMDRI